MIRNWNLCFATNNHHKLDEVMVVLGMTFQLRTLEEIGCQEELPETQDTIAGNARQKAQYVWDHYKIPCFADDTGLEVEALNGAPGVYSASYAGPQRNNKDNCNLLLERMRDIPRRDAQFRTVISLMLPNGEWSFEGIVRGIITIQPRGDAGFGYDPIFQPLASTKTLAEMTMEEKNQISHRGIAVKKLAEFLKTQ